MSFSLTCETTPNQHGNLQVLDNHTFPNGRKFPDSYIRFVKRYGYGLSCGSFLIYIPMNDHPDSWHVQNPIFKERFLSVLEWGDPEELKQDILFPDGSIELLHRAEPFAKSENGEYLFWDPDNGEQNEFDIYITDFKGVGFTKIAANLDEFFERVTNADIFKQVLPFHTTPLPKTFKGF